MARLPSAYQEVEWIQSDGGQHIISGFKPNGQTSVYGKIMFLPEGVTTNRWTWGCGADWNRNVFEFSIDVSNYHGFAWDYGANTGGGRLGSTPQANHVYSVEQVKNTLKIIDEIAGTTSHNTSYFSEQTFNTDMSFVIFSSARSEGSPMTPKAIMKLWYLKIYDNETLVRDYVPCYRISDGEIGLYDIVTAEFYANDGTGSFVKGPSVYNFPDFRAVKNFYMENGTPRLPEDYQEVEYIGASGSQYINTGVAETSNASWELGGRFRLTQTKSDDKQSFYGTDSLNFEIKTNSTNTDTTTSVDFGINQWHNIVSSKNYKVSPYPVVKSLDGTQLQNSTSTYFMGGKFRLFASYYSYVFRMAKADCSEMYIKKDGELIRDFIPCYRKSDGVIGMYDTVGSTFYANAGSGTFIKGNDVDTRMEVVEISRYVGTSRMILWSTIDYDITVDSFIDNYFYSDGTRATARQNISNYLKNGYKYIVMIKFSNPNNSPDWLFFTNVIICDHPFTLFDDETDYGTFEVGSSGYQCGTNVWDSNYYSQTYTIESSPVFIDKMSNNCPVSAFGRSDCLVYTNFDTTFYGHTITKNLDTSPYL